MKKQMQPVPTAYRRTPKFCAPKETDIPLRLKSGVAPPLLALPKFRMANAAELVEKWAHLGVQDKATAIAMELANSR